MKKVTTKGGSTPLSMRQKVLQMLWKGRYAINAVALSCVSLVQNNPILAAAADKTDKTTQDNDATNFDFLTTGKSNGIFSKVTTAIKQSGRSFYQMIVPASIIILVAGLVMLAAGFVFNKENPQKKQENKSYTGNLLIAGGIIFGIPGLLGIFLSIGSALL